METKIVICDSSVLINFLKVDRLDLFAKHSHTFLVTDHVQEEISDHYPEQKRCFQAALAEGILEVLSVTKEDELDIFCTLSKSGQLGSGECSAIAVAVTHGYKLAIEDNQALKRALALFPKLKIMRTQDLLLSMHKEGILHIEDADIMLETWAAKHRFKLKIQSIRQLI